MLADGLAVPRGIGSKVGLILMRIPLWMFVWIGSVDKFCISPVQFNV